MNELNNIETLIIRSLDQTASDGELRLLSEWIDASEENKVEYFRLKDIWDTSSVLDIDDPKEAWISFEKQLPESGKLRYIGKEIVKIAAVAVLAMLVTYVFINQTTIGKQDLKYAKVIVPNGSQSIVELPDGTVVRLNAGSEISYPAVFNSEIRHVELSGEGYFNVKHNAEHPFMVSAGDIEVRVLGTEFNVMAYPEFNRIETTLINGKVRLNKKGNEPKDGVILTPGQKATFVNGELSIDRANLDIETDWLRNSFYFKNTSFKELITRLERWYDVDIVTRDCNFDEVSFTGKFKNNETIWQVLDAIKMTSPIDYQVKDGIIYIKRTNN